MSKARELLGQRYGRAEDWTAAAELNPVLETIFAHRSVRGFLGDALPAGTLELLLAAAPSAASSSNLQVWSVVSVEDPARKERLAEHAGKATASSRRCTAWVSSCSELASGAALSMGRHVPTSQPKESALWQPWPSIFPVTWLPAHAAA